MAIIWIVAIVGASKEVKEFTEDLVLVVVVDNKFKLDQDFNSIKYQLHPTCSKIIIVVNFSQEAAEVSLTNQELKANLKLVILD